MLEGPIRHWNSALRGRLHDFNFHVSIITFVSFISVLIMLYRKWAKGFHNHHHEMKKKNALIFVPKNKF